MDSGRDIFALLQSLLIDIDVENYVATISDFKSNILIVEPTRFRQLGAMLLSASTPASS
jgi:hypothetical protein